MTKKSVKKEAQIGDKAADGTILAGISPDTNRHIYAAPADLHVSLNFNEAAKYEQHFEVEGKRGFRLPSKAELDVLFQNREKGDLKGTFNSTCSNITDCYLSSTPSIDGPWVQQFDNGRQTVYNYDMGGGKSRIRFVRS